MRWIVSLQLDVQALHTDVFQKVGFKEVAFSAALDGELIMCQWFPSPGHLAFSWALAVTWALPIEPTEGWAPVPARSSPCTFHEHCTWKLTQKLHEIFILFQYLPYNKTLKIWTSDSVVETKMHTCWKQTLFFLK